MTAKQYELILYGFALIVFFSFVGLLFTKEFKEFKEELFAPNFSLVKSANAETINFDEFEYEDAVGLLSKNEILYEVESSARIKTFLQRNKMESAFRIIVDEVDCSMNYGGFFSSGSSRRLELSLA